MSLNMHFTAPVTKKMLCEMGFSDELSLNRCLPPVLNNEVCKKEFDEQSNLNKNLHVHSVAKSFISDKDVCKGEQSNSLLRARLMKDMQDVKKPFSSDSVCKKEIDEQPSFDQHFHAQTVGMLFPDEKVCEEKYDEQLSLNQHMPDHIVDQSTVSADTCKQGLDEQLSFDQHLHAHSVEKSFISDHDICKDEQPSPLLRVMLTKNHIQDIKKPFSDDSVLKTEIDEQPSFDQHLHTQTVEMFPKKEICEEKDDEQLSLNQHVPGHNVNQSSISADACKQELDEQLSVDQHLHAQSLDMFFAKEELCEEEDEQLNLNQYFSAHNVNHSSTSADTCEEELKEQPNLNQYLLRQTLILNQRLHTESLDKTFVCEICLKGCSSKASFRTHLRTHYGETPFVCVICDKRFKQKEDLTEHNLIHMGKKFLCEVCQKEFIRKSNLTRHLEVVHNYKKSSDNDKGQASDTNSEELRAKADMIYNRQVYKNEKLFWVDQMHGLSAVQKWKRFRES